MSEYPTQKQLNTIRKWDIFKKGIFPLVDYVRSLWWVLGYIKIRGKQVVYIEMHTVGWSGNESIIEALQGNLLFFPCFWEKSVKGGHYYFKIDKRCGFK